MKDRTDDRLLVESARRSQAWARLRLANVSKERADRLVTAQLDDPLVSAGIHIIESGEVLRSPADVLAELLLTCIEQRDDAMAQVMRCADQHAPPPIVIPKGDS